MTEPLSGADALNIALLLNRVSLGLFFVLARFRFFFDPSKPPGQRWCNPERHKSLTHKMDYCGLKHWPYGWAWTTAIVEIAAGAGVILGLLTPLAGLGLFVLLLVATRCTAISKVKEQNPVDAIDCVSCYLWRVEGLYIIQAMIVLLAGPGTYSLDALIFTK
jgi:uncharacterized membrane protein YphA (DoxX/SURF4 family)